MNVYESIKNIRAKCNNYVEPDLVSTIIDDNYYMGSNNISEMTGYGISEADSYEEKFMKILKCENIFISCGMLVTYFQLMMKQLRLRLKNLMNMQRKRKFFLA